MTLEHPGKRKFRKCNCARAFYLNSTAHDCKLLNCAVHNHLSLSLSLSNSTKFFRILVYSKTHFSFIPDYSYCLGM